VTTPKNSAKQSSAQKPKFTTIIFLIGGLVMLGYYLLGVFHFTDNGFVVQVSTPMAPRVSGVVTQVHVKNGQRVKAGDVLVTLDPTSYEQKFQSVVAQYEQALISLEVSTQKIKVSENSLQAASANLDTLKTQFNAKDHPGVRAGVSQIDMSDLRNRIKAQTTQVESSKVQIAIDKLQVQMQEKQVQALKAAMHSAETDLKHTSVIAPVDGVIENVFLGIGAHVSSASGMFTLINDGETYIQANYEETELAGVKAGDRATIYPRIYFGKKSFEGVVVANPFGVSRQMNTPMSGSPYVATENKWLLLPQRLPVIIKITDVDEKYPLVNGMSAYVRLHN
jgi:multidrug resistance efflux pump